MLDTRPARSKEDHDGDRPGGEILLVLGVFVRGDKHIELCRFGRSNELAVLKRGPTTLVCGFECVTAKHPAQRRRSALIIQDLHLRHCQCAPGCVFQHGAHLLERYTREPFNKLMG